MNMTVVIATSRREGLLARTLCSLARCRLPSNFDSVLVVENGVRGTTEEVVHRASPTLRARYLFEPAANKSRALNAATRAASDSFLVFLDDDVLVDVGLLESYALAARKSGPGCFFGGRVVPDYEEPPPTWLVGYLPLSARGLTSSDLSPDPAKRWFLGLNWAAYARDITSVGGFDERLGPGGMSHGVGDETELQARLRTAGIRPEYLESAVVHHWVPRERCSPEWALRRTYVNGLCDALITGDPRGLFTAVTGECIRAQVRSVKGDRLMRFAARKKYRRWLGVIRGLSLRRAYARHRRVG